MVVDSESWGIYEAVYKLRNFVEGEGGKRKRGMEEGLKLGRW